MISIRTISTAAALAASLLLVSLAPAAAAPGFNLGLGIGGGGVGITIGGGGGAGGGNCLSEAQIESAIASGQIKSWAQIRQLANIPKNYREASDVRVCMRGGAPFYIVSMVSPKGEYFKLVLNAVDGSS